MFPSPDLPAYYARLKASESEIKRRKQEALEGVMAALAAQKEGRDHPRLLTKERKEALYILAIKKIEHREMSRLPRLPQIFVTRPMEDWRDFTNTIRGRFGAQMQE